MHGLLEMTFVSEIVLQTKIAKKAAERLQTANDNLDSIEVWGAIQSILVATGNISKILWPPYKTDQARGEKLRQVLGVEKDNMISERKFRNHFEHYDNRIEEYFNKQGNGGVHYTDLAMNPSLSEYLIGLQYGSEFASQFKEQLDNIHRGYNSFNNTLIYWGDVLDLDKLMKALDGIHEACKKYGYNW